MHIQELSVLTKEAQINGKLVVLRLYNSKIDDKKLIKTLFTKMDNEKGLKELREGDKEYFTNSELNFRLVAECDNELIASLTLMNEEKFKINSKMTVYSVVTKKEYQGSGVSALLFNFACSWAKKLGESEVIVNTDNWNIRAQKFYEKMGCKEIEKTEDQIIYLKIL